MSRAEDLARLREEMQAGQRDRMEFVTNLTRAVAGLRKRFMDENRAAHVAWLGPTRGQVTEPTERTAVEPGAGEKADMPGFEAAQRASEEAEASAMKEGGKPSKKPSRKGQGRVGALAKTDTSGGGDEK